MKFSLAASSFLLLVVTFVLVAACPRETVLCCAKHSKTSFPQKLVTRYFYTSSTCHLHSVVFIFNHGRQGCADPNAQWAKILVEYLDNNNPIG